MLKAEFESKLLSWFKEICENWELEYKGMGWEADDYYRGQHDLMCDIFNLFNIKYPDDSRGWLIQLDEIDLDCIFRYEKFFERKLKNDDEYYEIDQQVDDMVLDYESAEEFFEDYPQLLKYKNTQE